MNIKLFDSYFGGDDMILEKILSFLWKKNLRPWKKTKFTGKTI